MVWLTRLTAWHRLRLPGALCVLLLCTVHADFTSDSSLRRSDARRPPGRHGRRTTRVATNRVQAGSGQLSLHTMCSSSSVLARGSTGPVFGNGRPGDTIRVELRRGSTLVKQGSAKVDASGRWLARLGSLSAGAGYTIKASSASGASVTASNVAVGELWLVAGQSNVAINLDQITRINEISFPPFTQEAKKQLTYATTRPLVHLLKVPQGQSSSARADLPAQTKWSVDDAAFVRTFSAIGYLTFVELSQQLQVPVGVVQASYGGTSIVQWLPPAVLATINKPSTFRDSPKRNSYNAMIAPLKGTAWSGVLWYQGESDAGLEDVSPLYQYYTPLLKALLSSWRSQFGQPSLFWEIIQLPIYNSAYRPLFNVKGQSGDNKGLNHWPFVRESQREVANADSNAALVSAFDLGLPGRIHPPNKFLLGKRIVQSILNHETGSSRNVPSGPTVQSARNSGSGVTVSFGNVAGGLMIAIKQPFTVEGIDRKPRTFNIDCFEVKVGSQWVAATGNLASTTTVTVRTRGRASGVRYGWKDFEICNLFNESDLPAVPFEIAVS